MTIVQKAKASNPALVTLSKLKGLVGEDVINSIVKERNENGKFESFTDFCERIKDKSINKRCIESLIKAGAFDDSNPPAFRSR